MTEEGQFGTRQIMLHGVKLWWVCRKLNGRYVPYADVHAPTGYGFKSRAHAERKASEIEAVLEQADQRATLSVLAQAGIVPAEALDEPGNEREP